MVLILGLAKNKNRCLIIAHRGASFDAPENTVAAIKLAWQMKSPASECDIHLSKDNKIMVMHDANTIRTTGVAMMIKDADSADLRKLDAGSFKAEKYKGEKVPYLEEFIETLTPAKKLFVEIKCGPEVLPYLEKVINDSGKRKQIVIIGFNWDVVSQAKKVFADIPVYWLVYSGQDDNKQWIPYSEDLIAKAKADSLDGLNVHYGALTADFVQKAHQAGLKIFVWTVDDRQDVEKMRSFAVDGITTNKPNLYIQNH
ncbi:MAG TPA: glycerophosphodiester phosphodiesterase [Phycisphaerales bacterium]|nr:glycerophosphodiester phosphodiesterase [Phycisphaerales bacterium]